MEKLDAENLAKSLDKCRFACRQVEWLGYTINSECSKLSIRKTEAIENFPTIPNLAQTTVELQTWNPEHKTSFKNINLLVSEITQNKHFDQRLETRIICDASTSSLGASLEQHSQKGWVTIAYESTFFKFC